MRKPSLSAWSLGYLTTLAAVLVLAVLTGFGDVHVPWWVAVLVWLPLLVFTFWKPRRPSWRVTDDRRPSWADKDSDS